VISDYSDDGYVQDYDLGRQQELFIYCRLCRSTFAVTFKPKTARVKLRCLCGHQAPLFELDVFRTEKEAKHHAALYEKVYQAAKTALRDAGLELPPSGKYRKIEDVERDSQFMSIYRKEEDASAIRDAYVSESGSDEGLTQEGLEEELMDFEERVDEAADVIERHELLSELLEWAYCRRHFHPDVHAAFRRACQEDMRIAKELIQEVKRMKKLGQKVRLSFTSFKHLCMDLEEQDAFEEAAAVAEAAAKLGLKGYAERAEDYRSRA
jgi:hypothetical protein